MPSFSHEEGSKLVLAQLKRSDNERESAMTLSEKLGGLLLAIFHFTGYAARSSASVKDIPSDMQESQLASGPWGARESLAKGHYARMLRNVWDLALSEPSEGGRRLLNIFAFLNPDTIPENMFSGEKDLLGLGKSNETRVSAYKVDIRQHAR